MFVLNFFAIFIALFLIEVDLLLNVPIVTLFLETILISLYQRIGKHCFCFLIVLLCNMAAKDCLWLFDYYSLLLGISIFVHERCKFLVYFNYFRKSIQIILSFLAAICSFKMIFHSSTPLFELNYWMFYVGHLIFCMFMNIQGDSICWQFNNVFVRMKKPQKRRMCIISSCLTTVMILIHACLVVEYTILESKTNYSWDNYITMVSIQVNGDLYFHSLTWVSLLILGCYYNCQNCLNNINRSLTLQSERDATLSQFILSRAAIIRRSVSAVNRFSGFPLLVTIGYIFIGFSGILSYTRNSVNTLLLKVSECIYLATYCLAIVALLIMITVLRHKLESQRSALVFRLSHENHERLTVNWKIGLETLCDPKLFEFTVIDFLSLDMSLILKFAASQITFTVLMLQLESSV